MKQTKHRLILFGLLIACLLLAVPTHVQAAEKKEQTVFFGESTTAHLARRGGVLDTPEGRGLVWRDESGTCRLSRRILSTTIDLYGANGKRTVSLVEALEAVRPTRLVLSFGLNGIMGFIENKESFTGAYRVLIDGIRRHSPATEIVLQSVYPVRAATGFSCDTDTLNSHIRTLNEWIRELARTEGLGYADTASLLCDRGGALRREYDCGDGIHLTNGAYEKILAYFA